MTKFEYAKGLKKLIKKHGHWSEEVKEWNNKAIDSLCYSVYYSQYEMVLNQLRNKK